MRQTPSWLRPAFISLALTTALAAPVFAQQTYVLEPPVVGSGNTADADPPVIRPTTRLCKVQLYEGLKFNGFNTQTFNYTPPADCPGPWSKVVFVADFGVNGTNQFDRTAEIQLGDTMIYFGTTQEPSPTEQPFWEVQSDLTDYSALLKTSQLGTIELGNVYDSTYNGIQYSSAYLEFYPADDANPAPRVADQVLPLPVTAGAPGLNTGSDTLSETFTLPQNVEAAYLDVFTQGQSNDEFWWSCVPNDTLSILGADYNCGNSAFRQTQVTIDGQLAGLAPVYPYVFTGGVDPDLWRPIPGIQTLNFKPYRVDLTPFAGNLSNGKPHTITVSVFNADSYFSADATLLIFQDPNAKTVTGGLISSTLEPTRQPAETVNLSNYATTGAGSVVVSEGESYKTIGSVNTSHGVVQTTAETDLSFTNSQVYTAYTENLTQDTKAYQTTTTTANGATYVKNDHIDFPIQYNFSETINPDNSGSETLAIGQQLTENISTTENGKETYSSTTTDQVGPVDELVFDASGNLTSEPIDTNTETYTYKDSLGHCWNRSVSAANALVSAVSDGKGCPNGVNQW